MQGAADVPQARQRKLAELIAGKIQDQLVKIGWPVGQVLGNETQLMETYGVSRATLREAIRQLERHGVATMRRGFGGGLVVQEPAQMAAVQALATYWELTDVSLDELFEARGILEYHAVELAIRRLSDADIAVLRRDLGELRKMSAEGIEREVKAHRGIRRTIAAATQNPALALFLESLNRVTGALMPDYPRLARMQDARFKMRELRENLVEAVIAGDLQSARQAVQAELADSYDAAKRNLERFRREAGNRSALDAGSAPQIADWDANRKLPHRLAVVIAREVAHSRQPPGTRIGMESEFLARFGVSRAVFREAVRTLEGYGIVAMRRGFNGGLVAGTADPEHTVSLVAGYLRHAAFNLGHFFEVLRALELAVAPLAAARASREQIAGLLDAVAGLELRTRRAMLEGLLTNSLRLHECAGNRAIALIGRVIGEFSPTRDRRLPPLHACQTMVKCQQEILAAVAARDESLARRKAIRALRTSSTWWSGKSGEDERL